MEKALQTIVAPGSKISEDDSLKKAHTADALSYVQLLFDNVAKDVSSVFGSEVLHSKYLILHNQNLTPSKENHEWKLMKF